MAGGFKIDRYGRTIDRPFAGQSLTPGLHCSGVLIFQQFTFHYPLLDGCLAGSLTLIASP